MTNRRRTFGDEKELQEAILQEKARGTPDLEIGQKYGVTFRYIERLVTRSQGVNVSTLGAAKRVKTLHPRGFREEQDTVWSFKQRGNWATHSGEYRGNWSPYIPRNVILRYSRPGEVVLDYFCGAGTTAVEAKLLGRRCIALDINDKALELARENVSFRMETQRPLFEASQPEVYEPDLLVGDARDLSFLPENSIDLICAHPPYANIIQYTDSRQGDLSFLDIAEFLEEMAKVAQESFRVLKPGRQCAILIGDTRRQKRVIPLGFQLIDVYLAAGFKLRELVIKRQHNCKTTGFWYANSVKYNFLLLAHEYLPVFEKATSPGPLRMSEETTHYSSLAPILEPPPLKQKVDQLETTTVWVLPESDFEERLNKNVVDRYSGGAAYSVLFFAPHRADGAITMVPGERRLLMIKAPFLLNDPTRPDIEFYLQKTHEAVQRSLPKMTNGGFIVVQTQDVRVDGYVEPLAKRFVDLLKFDVLRLKEIIIATHPGRPPVGDLGEYLRTTHQYLLVYEVIR
jgi:SAM-dependent methyltransferase